MRLGAFALACLLPVAVSAFSLQWPVACTVGKDCFFQNLADHDTGPGAADFTCARVTYDGHDGTDIRLRDMAAMRAGVAVRAAADGEVLGTRSDVEDNGVTPTTKGRECGNGVHLQHTGGYRTQYCHLKKGSIRVHTGQHVKAGDVLGEIGYSGGTEFPHVHVGVWQGSTALDPFTGGPIANACGGADAPLWAEPVALVSTALLNHGFATAALDAKTVRDTPPPTPSIGPSAPALLYWFDLMNLRAGDVLAVRITAPDGTGFAETSKSFDAPKAVYFGFVGKKSRGALPTGTYTVSTTLTRAGKVIVSQTAATTVK